MKLRLAALLTLTLLSACRSRGDVLDTGGVYEVRSACPVAGVPAGTGDVTLFNPPTSNDSRAIDVTAAISDVRAVCQDVGNDVEWIATARDEIGEGLARGPRIFYTGNGLDVPPPHRDHFIGLEDPATARRVVQLLHEHGVQLDNEISNVRRWSMACVAWPTCGLSITEAERALPLIVD